MHVYKFMSFENAIVRHQIWFKMGLISMDMYTHHTCTMYTYFHDTVPHIVCGGIWASSSCPYLSDLQNLKPDIGTVWRLQRICTFQTERYEGFENIACVRAQEQG